MKYFISDMTTTHIRTHRENTPIKINVHIHVILLPRFAFRLIQPQFDQFCLQRKKKLNDFDSG